MDREPHPPRIATRLLRWVLERMRYEGALPGSHQDVLGDLEEEWRIERGTGGAVRAGVLYAWRAAGVALWLLGSRVRTDGPFPGLRDDVRAAARGLRRSPVTTLFAAVTLGVGAGGLTAVFVTLDELVLRAGGRMEDPGRVVTLWATTSEGDLVSPVPDQVELWETLDGAFERVHDYQADPVALVLEDRAVRGSAVRAVPETFSFLGGELHAGRYFTEAEARGAGAPVVLSWEFWRGRLDHVRDPLGTTLRVEGEDRTVVGVAAPRIVPPGWRPGMADVWLPPEGAPFSVQVLARLRPGVELADANRMLEEAAVATATQRGEPVALWLGRAVQPGRGPYYIREPVELAGAAAALLFLAACATVAMLFAQRRLRRRRELAFRLALGAGAGRLMRVRVLEGAIVGLGAGVLSLAVAGVGLEALELSSPERMPLLAGFRIGGRAILFGLAVALLAGVVAAAVPGRWRRVEAPLLGRVGGPATRDDGGLRWLFLASEVGLSFALLLGTLLLVDTVKEIGERDPGYRTEGVGEVTVELPPWRYEDHESRETLFRAVRAGIAALPGVEGVALAVGLPPGMEVLTGDPRAEGEEPSGRSVIVWGGRVEPGFLETMEIELLAGRRLRPEDADDGSRSVAVVGRALARHVWGDAPPAEVVGRRLDLERIGTSTVVGVVEDIRIEGLGTEPDRFTLYRPLRSLDIRLSVVFRAADPAALLPAAEDVVRSLEPEAFVGGTTAEARLAATLAGERFLGRLTAIAAGLALFLSALGLYGVLSQSVVERYHELGVRASLGAGAARLRWVVTRSAAGVVGAGMAVGAAASLAALRWLSIPFLPAVADVPTLLRAGALLVLIALPAVWIPAERATRVDPAEALRDE